MSEMSHTGTKYEGLDSDELMELVLLKRLDNAEDAIVRGVLISRGVSLPDYCMEQTWRDRPQTPTDRLKSLISDGWQGKATLSAVYWGIGLLHASLFVTLLLISSVLPSGAVSEVVSTLALCWFFVGNVFHGVCAWRCSGNASWYVWTNLARFAAGVQVIVFAVVLPGAMLIKAVA